MVVVGSFFGVTIGTVGMTVGVIGITIGAVGKLVSRFLLTGFFAESLPVTSVNVVSEVP